VQSVVADIVVSPVLAANELRVVLTWGAQPPDLDSHLYGPPSANDFHVYYFAPSALPYAALDRDDTDGRGPETVTLRVQSAGTHVYAVHDFTNQLSTTSSVLGASGARVQVYRSSGLAADFTVPNLPGTLWTVFTLDGGTITPVNRMSFASPVTRPSTSLGNRVAPVAAGPSLSRVAPLPAKSPAAARP